LIAEMHFNAMRERQGVAVVAASFTALLVSPLSLLLPTVGLFVGPVSTEFGWNRATFFLGPSIGAIVGALVAPFLGALADRWGAKPVLATGIVIYALGVAALGTLTGWLPGYVAICVVLFAAGQVQTSPLYSRVAASWFDQRRGLMIGLATSGLGVGGFVIPFIAKRLMEIFGWRWTYAGLGLLILIVALPVVLLVVRERPAIAKPATIPRTALPGLTLRQSVRTRSYWTLIAFFLCVSFALTGIVVNLVPMLARRGVSSGAAVLAVSTVAISQTIGRLTSGYLLDKVVFPQISLIWFVGSAIGLSVLLIAKTPAAAIVAAAMLGLAWGAEGEMTGYYVSRYFGVHHLARIAGTLFLAIGLTAAASQMTVARLFDRTHNYQYAIAIAIVSMIVACLLLASLGPYTYTMEPDDDSAQLNNISNPKHQCNRAVSPVSPL
jgi:MFS family permease